MRYTLVGGGIAAASAAQSIRRLDPGAHISVISEERHCFYYRPMTPLVVKGDRERDEILAEHPGDDHLHLIHDRACSLDHDTRQVMTASGRAVPYDRLLIATGSRPRIPEIPGIREPNVYYLRTIDDARLLNEAGKHAKQAVVLGGGFVGIKKACALAARGIKVTVIEMGNCILAPRVDREAATTLTEVLAQKGIDILVNDSIAAIGTEAKSVTLASGRELRADFVCVAVGVIPNIDWLRSGPMAIDRAIVVDRRMQTSLPDVYAAGDVVETEDLVSGKPMVSALWTHAVAMGKIAGINMAGGKAKHEGFLEVLNATEIEGIPLITTGQVTDPPPAGAEIFRRRRGDSYRKLVIANDRLIGGLWLGDVTGAGVCTTLVRSQAPLGGLKDKMVHDRLTYLDYATHHH